MTRRLFGCLFVIGLGVLAAAPPAAAQQSVNVQLGYFVLRDYDARVHDDVLVTNRQYLLFDLHDFSGFTGGGEWLIAMGGYFEAGVGATYFQRSTPAIYDGWVNANGSEIQQELKLRVIPLAATVKILPFGARHAIQPYVGGGLGIYFWRYSETGEFVDFSDHSIFRASFVDTGTSVGPVAIFGVRGRVSPQIDLGMEVRLQWGQGSLSNDFLSDRIDLGGVNVLSTFRYRF